MRSMLSYLPRLWANWITLLGSILTTITGFAILLYIVVEMSAPEHNPYASGFIVLSLPILFLTGLLLIPIGLLVDRRRRRRGTAGEDAIERAFTTALTDKRARMRILFVAVMTVINVVLFGYAGHKTVEYADSPKFCGTTCHRVMGPEWESYNRSPHAHVACVQCHIGPGVSAEVKAKVNGLNQVYELATNSYHRPIPAPVGRFRAATETCASCHWPERWSGNKLKLFPHYKDEKDNTPSFNAEFLHVGGRSPETGRFEGIHGHNDPDKRITYEYLDAQRTRVGKITVYERGQLKAVYLPKGPMGEAGKALGERTMDCVDCHSRPTHIQDYSARAAIDRAMFEGRLDAKLPYLVQIAAALLERKDIDRDRADAQLAKALAEEYERHPDAKAAPEAIAKNAKALADIYRHDIWPEMKIGWRTYRNNLQHEVEGEDAAGCFRCHDGERKAKLADGTTKELSQECSTCHEQVAFEADPDKFDDTLKAILSKGD